MDAGRKVRRPAGRFLGDSVAIAGDTIAAGAPRLDGGYVRLYAHSGGAWDFEQELSVDPASVNGAYFGGSLAIDGDALLVGAPLYDSLGAAFPYRRIAGAWEPEPSW